MANVNRILLVGNLGRIESDQLTGAALEHFDSLYEAYRRLCSRLTEPLRDLAPGFATKWQQTCSELALALKALKRLIAGKGGKTVRRCARPRQISVLSKAFFHSCKVDERNLP